MAPLIRRLRETKGFEIRLCNTGQHRELLDPILRFFKLEINYSLKIMTEGQGLQQLTSSVILKTQPVFEDFHPDLVLVHGDTTTSFATSLSAFYAGIQVAHVEAGLRTYQKHAPFPEEINRHLTAILADIHFSPTRTAADNLRREGITNNVFVTGNTVIDALFDALTLLDENDVEIQALKRQVDFSKKIILFTGHRRENFGKGFEEIFSALQSITNNREDVVIIYPVHPNPRVKAVAEKYFLNSDKIILVEPLGYGPFIWLMQKAYIILTDSGGIQEEAPSLGKPILVLREVTERPEAVLAGTVTLVGTNQQKIIEITNRLLDDSVFYSQMTGIHNPYGDGKASERIIGHLKALSIAH